MGTEFSSFTDRNEAGALLADRLIEMRLNAPVVYALPRGGVPVAAVVAQRLAAPLDLILVRKIGAPGNPEVALGALVEGDIPETVINEDVLRLSGADDAYLQRATAEQLEELRRRRALYLGDRPRLDPRGRTAIVVDDGLATGATMKAALIAIRRQGAGRIVVALPVAPREALPEIAAQADDIVCLIPARQFRGVGAFYRDFHQLTDAETVGILKRIWAAEGQSLVTGGQHSGKRGVRVPPMGLMGDLTVPKTPRGIVVFAHGSGSSRLSPRNIEVAERLNERGFATLLFDLLTPDEGQDRSNVFDVPLLAERVIEAAMWVASEPDIAELPLCLFGASTGAAAALLAASELKDRVSAVVSRGGRPDLAGKALPRVTAPTLLIVGGDDGQVIDLNRQAHAALGGEKLLQIVPGASHLFEEPGTMEAVIRHAAEWFEQHTAAGTEPAQVQPAAPGTAGRSLGDILRRAAEPLPAPDDPSFGAAFDRFGAARIVLLGEASHGTSEFYVARAAITRRLIEKHGFSVVAVEADWPDAAAIDRHVRHLPHRPMAPQPFSRFPTWMWRNREVDDFLAFLRRHNADIAPGQRVAFRGLDLYNMTGSIAAVLEYLDRVDPEAAAAARARYACLAPWSHEPSAYGRAALTRGYALCEEPVTRILVDLFRKQLDYRAQDGDQFFDAAQNARAVSTAERYYRIMYYGSQASWNLRDTHMFETLQNILNQPGPEKKIVVWAHNSHIGDARFTDMGQERDELNLGQLCRQEYGRSAALIGFGTDRGTVVAAREWDAPMQVVEVRPGRPESYESLCHDVGLERYLFDFRPSGDADLRRALTAERLERYIGVIYRPETERWSHYSFATLPDQYDAYVWFDKTSAVTPLPADTRRGEDETYPFGL